MKLTLTIDMDNAAFESPNAGPEAARILRHVARKVDGYTGLKDFECPLMDINGNRVGQAEVTE